MQTAALPISTCEATDKACRNFIWGDKDDTKRPHLVSWDTLTKKRCYGGLGLRKSCSMNKALLMKLGWNLIEKKERDWAKVVRSKYGCGNKIIPIIKYRGNASISNTWHGICRTWKVKKGLVLYGTSISIRGIWESMLKKSRRNDFFNLPLRRI